jgi:hypothetical protein
MTIVVVRTSHDEKRSDMGSHKGSPLSAFVVNAADVWAVGCVLHELCSLQRLFDGDSK